MLTDKALAPLGATGRTKPGSTRVLASCYNPRTVVRYPALSVSTTKMTARQFLMLGEDPPGVRLELFNGEIAVSPSPAPKHQYTVVALASLLFHHVEANDLGEVLIDLSTRLDRYNVPRPDILFFAKSRRHLMGKKYPTIPPDLCVEVLSPGSRKIDRIRKFKLYAERGVAYYWIVDPTEHTIESFQLIDSEYKETGSGVGDGDVRLAPFPELKILLKRLWRPD